MSQCKSADAVFKYFYEISKIPRGSGNTKAVSDYCVNVAKEHNLWYRQDEYNNVLIKRPASKGYEDREPVILQGHLDMVCEKENGIEFDFLKDSLKIKQEGDFIFAEGTTLGADNGIAVSYALAILTDNEIEAPEIEAIFTADEETGMDGAIGLDVYDIKSKTMLNIDSEDEGVFTVSCAGGINVESNIKISREEGAYKTVKVIISGLLGGHSGVEIHKKRANSNVLSGKLLKELANACDIRFVSVNGGNKLNAIASYTELVVAYNDNEEKIIKVIKDYGEEVKKSYKDADPKLTLTYEIFEKGDVKVAREKDTLNISDFLQALPDGVYSMSEDIEGLVKTSSNFGILKTEEETIYALLSVRSSVEKEKTILVGKIFEIVADHNGTAMTSGDYPAWEYKKDSKLRKIMCEVFEKQYNKPPVTEAIHAGLECGIFSGKIPGLDCVSFGPDLFDIHTPKERVSKSSVIRVWKFILEVLKNC